MFWLTVTSVITATSLTLLVTITFASEDGHELDYDQWQFSSTRMKSWSGRTAKLGDCCCYQSWQKHAQPIIRMMKYYNRVKKHFRHEHEIRNKTLYPSEDPYQFITEVATRLSKAREDAAMALEKQIKANDFDGPIKFPPTCCATNDPDRNRSMMRMLCEGGELMRCKQHEDSEEGTCHCFDVMEAKPMYFMEHVDGHCRASPPATCNGEDPVISAACGKKYHCVNFTTKACKLAFGDEFHCEGVYDAGSKKLTVGHQNLYCAQHFNQPESWNDFGVRMISDPSWLIWLLLPLGCVFFRYN